MDRLTPPTAAGSSSRSAEEHQRESNGNTNQSNKHHLQKPSPRTTPRGGATPAEVAEPWLDGKGRNGDQRQSQVRQRVRLFVTRGGDGSDPFDHDAMYQLSGGSGGRSREYAEHAPTTPTGSAHDDQQEPLKKREDEGLTVMTGDDATVYSDPDDDMSSEEGFYGDDVETIANDIGADPAAIYEKIRVATLQQQMLYNNEEGVSDDQSSLTTPLDSRQRLLDAVRKQNTKDQHGLGGTATPSEPNLVEVEFEDEDPELLQSTSAGGRSSEMQVSRSSLSSAENTTVTRTMQRSDNAAAANRRGVKFGGVVVSNVCVYEVDSTLYVAVEYQRHWLAWVTLLLGLLFDVVFSVHFTYFVVWETYGAGATGAIAADFWVSFCHAVWCMILLGCGYATGVGTSPSLRFIKTLKGGLLYFAMSMGQAVALALIAVTIRLTGRVHFYTMVNMHSAWILLYRLMGKEHIFFAEVAGVIVAIGGFIVSGAEEYKTAFTKDNEKYEIEGNVLLFVCSLCFTLFYLSLQTIRYKVPITMLAVAPALCSIPLTMFIGVGFDVPFTAALNGMFGLFSGDKHYFLHCALMALEHLISILSYFMAVRYLDILSVSACFTLKTVLVPIGNNLLVFNSKLLREEAAVQQWNATFFVGAAIALLGTIFVVIFASVKRQFVARRLALERRKRVPDPYRKRRQTGYR